MRLHSNTQTVLEWRIWSVWCLLLLYPSQLTWECRSVCLSEMPWLLRREGEEERRRSQQHHCTALVSSALLPRSGRLSLRIKKKGKQGWDSPVTAAVSSLSSPADDNSEVKCGQLTETGLWSVFVWQTTQLSRQQPYLSIVPASLLMLTTAQQTSYSFRLIFYHEKYADSKVSDEICHCHWHESVTNESGHRSQHHILLYYLLRQTIWHLLLHALLRTKVTLKHLTSLIPNKF